MTIPDSTLQRWRELAERATPGEWHIDLDDNEQSNIYAGRDNWIAILPHQCVTSIEEERKRDAAFIAAARTAVPALLDLVAQLTRERDEAVGLYATGLKGWTVTLAAMQAERDAMRSVVEAAERWHTQRNTTDVYALEAALDTYRARKEPK